MGGQQFDGGDAKKGGDERSSVEKRFAYNLLEKLINYLEHAALRMKAVKPSQELTRKNSFRASTKNVKFFEKVRYCRGENTQYHS